MVTIDEDDSADKVLADIGTYQAQQSKIPASKFADPDHPTREELLSVYKLLRSITSKENAFIRRIDALLAADINRGALPTDIKEALQEYSKSLKEDLAGAEKAITDINSFLNSKADTSTSVVAASASTPPPQPASTPWYATPEAQHTWWALGAAAGIAAIHYIQQQLENSH